MNDAVTKENQKGHANYEADLKKSQSYREGKFKDEPPIGEKIGKKIRSVVEPIYNSVAKIAAPNSKKDEDVMRKAKGGTIKSASSRADGCAIRGKTKA